MKKLSFVFILLLFSVKNHSQELPKLLPAAPAAAELIKSIEYPVSYNTGLANINIPLHTINVGNVSLPIALNYNSRGFEKNIQEGVSGLGWSLSSDLQITRVVNGLDDFIYNINNTYGHYYYNNGYQSILSGCDASNLSLTEAKECEFRRKYKVDFKGDLDSQPDKFYYSLLSGRSGAFYFQNEQSAQPTGGTYTYTRSLIQWPHTGVKIEVATAPHGTVNGTFVITDLDGTEYHYGGISVEENALPNGVQRRRGDYISSWKCFKIVTANKQEQITFNYEPQVSTYTFSGEDKVVVHSNKSYSPTQPSIPTKYDVYSKISSSNSSLLTNGTYNALESSTYPHANLSYNGSSNGILKYPVHYTKHSTGSGSAYVFPTGEDDLILREDNHKSQIQKREQKRLRLSEINFPNGKAQYLYDASGSEVGQLNVINIKNKNNTLIKAFHFDQSTIGSNIVTPGGYSDYRFDASTSYLDGLRIVANTTLEYSFLYNFKEPYRNYAKGNGTSTIYDGIEIGDFSIYDSLIGLFTVSSGYLSNSMHNANWSTGTNIDYDLLSNKGMLTRITYPTKGYTVFEYESNLAYAYPSVNRTNTEIVRGYRIKSISSFDNNNASATKREFKYGKSENGGGIMKPLLYNQLKNSLFENILSMSLNYFDVINNTNSSGSSTSQMLSNSVETKTHYRYGMTRNVDSYLITESDILQFKLNGYTTNDIYVQNPSSAYSFIKNGTEIQETLKKNTFGALPNINNPVYYDVVTEYKSSEGPYGWRFTGKTVYSYRTKDTNGFANRYFGDYSNYTGQLNENYNWAYGQLASKIDYKAKLDFSGSQPQTTYDTIRKVVNSYRSHNAFNIYPPLGAIALGKRYFTHTTNVPLGMDNNISRSFFEEFGSTQFFTPQTEGSVLTGYVTLEESKETMYYDTGNVEKLISYTYHPETLLPTLTETISTGDTNSIKVENTYPNTAVPSSGINSLVAQYRLSELIKSKTYDGNKLLGTVQNNYLDWGFNSIGAGNLISQNTIQTAKGTNNLEDRIIYQSYYANGKPKEVSKANGTSIYYIWGL